MSPFTRGATAVVADAGRIVPFRTLTQSPLRASLLRHLHAHPDESFEVEALIRTFARIPFDIENCLRELAAQGLAHVLPGTPPRFIAVRPSDPLQRQLLEEFLAATHPATPEEQSPAVRRFRDLLGPDEKMLLVLESARTVAKTDLAVVIVGPAGTGKGVVARLIHEISRRRNHSFQPVECRSFPEGLFEKEVLGCEEGRGSGTIRRPGRIELASGGTVFLGGITGLTLTSQAILLKALEECAGARPEGDQADGLDVRVLSATDHPLDPLVAEGRFREDLCYRLNAFTIRLPSLRERPADIPVLARRFLAAHCVSLGLAADARVFSDEALGMFVRYGWPGNVREMTTAVARAALASSGQTIRPEAVRFLESRPAGGRRDAAEGVSFPPLYEVERGHILKVLQAVSWNKKLAARLLAISRETLYRKIRTYDLVPAASARGPA